MGIPHVGCRSQKLALEDNAMASAPLFNKVVDDLRSIMRDCKDIIMNRAMLHRLTELSPVLPSATRWSGLSNMLNRFISLEDDSETVYNTAGLSLTVPRAPRFRSQVRIFSVHLHEINTVSMKLQSRGAILDYC